MPININFPRFSAQQTLSKNTQSQANSLKRPISSQPKDITLFGGNSKEDLRSILLKQSSKPELVESQLVDMGIEITAKTSTRTSTGVDYYYHFNYGKDNYSIKISRSSYSRKGPIAEIVYSGPNSHADICIEHFDSKSKQLRSREFYNNEGKVERRTIFKPTGEIEKEEKTS